MKNKKKKSARSISTEKCKKVLNEKLLKWVRDNNEELSQLYFDFTDFHKRPFIIVALQDIEDSSKIDSAPAVIGKNDIDDIFINLPPEVQEVIENKNIKAGDGTLIVVMINCNNNRCVSGILTTRAFRKKI